MNSDFERILRRLKPHKQLRRLEPRQRSELPILGVSPDRPRTLLYDTTVYIDVFRGRFPATTRANVILRAAHAWHSTVTEAELSAACGLLDPTQAGTTEIVRRIARDLDRRPAHRTIAPDREVWREAGLLTATLVRLQGIPKASRYRLVNDALIFTTARKYGHTVLTRNITDFDLLQQLDPSGRVLFYDV